MTMAKLDFVVLTLFPDMIMQGLAHSIFGRAVRGGILTLRAVDIREFTEDRHRQADDYPYGGGCGMVLKPEPVHRAYLRTMEDLAGLSPRVLYMTPRGRPFSQAMAREYAAERAIVVLCGHYEGIDERAIDLIKPEEVSLGDFVLSGGEIGAMALADAVARLVPGVLKNEDSAVDESFSHGLLEYPQYTRPAEYMGLRVPDILLSGDHGKIRQWRDVKSEEITRERRPDMMFSDMILSDTILTVQTESELVFVRPDMSMKAAALDFRDEFIRENSRMNGSANFLKYETYEQWLDDLSLIERGQKEGRLASTVFFVMDADMDSDEIIGIADIRHGISDDRDHLPSYVNGHLGGSVRPSRRGLGYAQRMLSMSLKKCAEYGNRRILVSCDKNNPASEHIIVKCGGVFDNEVVEQNGNIIRRFWFG